VVGAKDYGAVSDRLRRFEQEVASSRVLEKAYSDAARILNLEICPFSPGTASELTWGLHR